MIFSTSNAVDQIIAGTKCQTRRLEKKDEVAYIKGMKFKKELKKIPQAKTGYGYVTKTIKEGVIIAVGKPDRKKWEVGRDYAVQLGKPGLWYCPKCEAEDLEGAKGRKIHNIKCYGNFKPLYIVITGIRKECLLDISERDARKEGFENQATFLKAFCEINNIRYCWQFPPASGYKFEKKLESCLNSDWFGCNKNPEVWVLNFKVKA